MRFRHLGKKDGLAQNSIFAITQDNRGVMWFGSREGINAYDGYNLKLYQNKVNSEQPLLYNDVRHLAYDQKRDAIWIGGLKGLSKLDFSSDQFQHFHSSDSTKCNIRSNDIQAIYLDSKDRVWIGTDKGVDVLLPDQKEFQPRYLRDIDEANTKAFLEDDQLIWIGTHAGLFILTEDQTEAYPAKKYFPELAEIEGSNFKTIHKTSDNQYWFGTVENGIFLWEKDQHNITAFRHDPNNPNSLSNNNIRSVAVAKDGTLWVGTWHGLNRYVPNKKGFQQIFKDDFLENGLRDNSVRSVFIDNKNNLWVGTYYGGINYLNEEFGRFSIYRHQVGTNSLSYDVVSSFAETKEGDLWIGTEGGGLNFWDQKTDQFKTVLDNKEKKFSGRNVKTLLLDGPNLFIGNFQEGLQCYNTETQNVKGWKYQSENTNSLSNNNVYALFKDESHLWIGTFGGGLDRLDLSTNKFTNYKHDPSNVNSLSSDLVRAILQTEENKLWVGTGSGLNQMTFEGDQLVEVQRFLPDTK
ncbi:MAG: two-component regulator propeller domain-containing protein, partial [Bacteroidota bacterium]